MGKNWGETNRASKYCGGVVDLLESKKVLQRDQDRLNCPSEASGMRLKKAKCQRLHSGHNNSKQCYRLETEYLETCNWEKRPGDDGQQ